MRNPVPIIVFLLVSLLSAGGWSAPMVLGDEDRIDVNGVVYFLEDQKGKKAIEDVRSEPLSWKVNSGSAFNRGYSSSAWWLSVSIVNNTDTPQERLLELSYAVLDYVDVFVYRGDALQSEFYTGDRLPYRSRPVDNRYFVIPVTWQPGQTLDIYFRIQTSSSVQAPLTLWKKDAFSTKEMNSNMLQGLYYGAMIVIVVYNLLMFMVLSDRSYFYYVGFVISIPLFFVSLSGQGFRYVWPEAVAWNAHSIPLFVASSIFFGALFTRRFLGLKDVAPFCNTLMSVFVYIGGATLVLSMFVSYQVSIVLLVPMGLLVCIAGLSSGLVALYRGVHSARFYCIAWGCFLVGTIVLALNKLDLLPSNVFTEYSTQLGSVLEAVLLSFAMAERINVEKRLRFEAQEETLNTARRLNEQLELRVIERTTELETLNERLQTLSDTDQLTNLKNRRFLEKTAEKEWSRCLRYQHPFSILMMDVDFFKQVNDKYGHPAGDVCLRQVADQVMSCVRHPPDVVARYGGEEFCMILPETDAEGAVEVAERVRERIQAHQIIADERTFSVSVSIGVYSDHASSTKNIEYALKCADLALYQSKETGRNRVTLYKLNVDNNVRPLVLPNAKKPS